MQIGKASDRVFVLKFTDGRFHFFWMQVCCPCHCFAFQAGVFMGEGRGGEGEGEGDRDRGCAPPRVPVRKPLFCRLRPLLVNVFIVPAGA